MTEALKQLDKTLEAIALTQNQLLPSSRAAIEGPIEICDAEDTIINARRFGWGRTKCL